MELFGYNDAPTEELNRQTLNILGYPVTVEFSDGNSGWLMEDCTRQLGFCNRADLVVLVNNTVDISVQRTTLCHEIAHFVTGMYSYFPEEWQVDLIAHGFSSFIENNLDFINKLYGK